MSGMAIYALVTFLILAAAMATNVFLFYTKVLTGLVDRGQKVDVDFWFFPSRIHRYTRRYAALLTPQERAIWSNRLAINLDWIVSLMGVCWILSLFLIDSLSK